MMEVQIAFEVAPEYKMFFEVPDDCSVQQLADILSEEFELVDQDIWRISVLTCGYFEDLPVSEKLQAYCGGEDSNNFFLSFNRKEFNESATKEVEWFQKMYKLVMGDGQPDTDHAAKGEIDDGEIYGAQCMDIKHDENREGEGNTQIQDQHFVAENNQEIMDVQQGEQMEVNLDKQVQKQQLVVGSSIEGVDIQQGEEMEGNLDKQVYDQQLAGGNNQQVIDVQQGDQTQGSLDQQAIVNNDQREMDVKMGGQSEGNLELQMSATPTDRNVQEDTVAQQDVDDNNDKNNEGIADEEENAVQLAQAEGTQRLVPPAIRQPIPSPQIRLTRRRQKQVGRNAAARSDNKRGRWSGAETQQLIEGLKELGKNWARIRDKYVKSRTNLQIKDKFVVMEKQYFSGWDVPDPPQKEVQEAFEQIHSQLKEQEE